MIEVVVTCNRVEDRATADTPEDAMFAAGILYDEMYRHQGGAFPVTTKFYVNDEMVGAVTGRHPATT